MSLRKPDDPNHIKGLLIETVGDTTRGHVVCEDGTEADLTPQTGEDIERAWHQAEHLCELHAAVNNTDFLPHVHNLIIRAKGSEQHYAFSSVGICKDGRTERSVSTLTPGQKPADDFLTKRLEELQNTCEEPYKDKA